PNICCAVDTGRLKFTRDEIDEIQQVSIRVNQVDLTSIGGGCRVVRWRVRPKGIDQSISPEISAVCRARSLQHENSVVNRLFLPKAHCHASGTFMGHNEGKGIGVRVE